MKHAIIPAAALLIGVISGYRSGSPAEVDETPSGNPEPEAVTFTGHFRGGNAEQLLAENPRGLKYSRTRLLELLRQANDSHDWSLRNAVLREWSQTETVDGVSALFESGHREEGWQLLAAWSDFHPEAAADLALFMEPEGLLESEHCGYALSNEFTRLLRTDPEKAVALEKRCHSEDLPFRTFQASDIVDWPTAAIKEALKALSAIEDPYRKWSMADRLIGQGGIPPREGIEWIEENLPLSRREHAFESALRPWIANDAESAAEFVESKMDGSPESRVLLRQFIRMMHGENRELLVDWMKRQNYEFLKDAAPLEWVFQSPDHHQSLAEVLGSGFEWLGNAKARSPFAPVFAGFDKADLPDTWPPKSKEEAGAWFTQSVPTTGLGPSFWTVDTMNETMSLLADGLENVDPHTAKNTAKRWAKHDPHAAIEWAAQLPDHLMIETAEAALEDWFSSEPTAALEYVNEMEPGEFRSYAVAQIAEDWFERERETAIQWVNSMPLGFDRDIGKQIAAETFLYQNPKRSYLNANAIGNRVLREEALENTFRHWLRKEPQDASGYLQQAEMNEELRASLQRLAETSPP